METQYRIKFLIPAEYSTTTTKNRDAKDLSIFLPPRHLTNKEAVP
jgi:hypothetical protein